MLKASGAYGWLGVEVFFVISGFVIPHALFSANYELRNYFQFVYKRIARLDPPYLVAITLTVFLGYVSTLMPGYKGEPFRIVPVQILLHMGYLNSFFKYEWLNPVFWTLAIEFQYYLLIGLIYPFIISSNIGKRVIIFALLVLLAFLLTSNRFIFHYLFLFMLGIATFQYRKGLILKPIYIAMVFFLSVGVFATLGLSVTFIGLVTASLIAFVEIKGTLPYFFGTISYSLYLLHVPIGGRLINLGVRYAHNTSSKAVFLATAVTASLTAAYLFFSVVEKPSQIWSSGIQYRKSDKAKNAPFVMVADLATYKK